MWKIGDFTHPWSYNPAHRFGTSRRILHNRSRNVCESLSSSSWIRHPAEKYTPVFFRCTIIQLMWAKWHYKWHLFIFYESYLNFRVKIRGYTQLAVRVIRIFGAARLVSDAFGRDPRFHARSLIQSLHSARAFLILIFELGKRNSRIASAERSQFLQFFIHFLYKYFGEREREREERTS